VDPKIDGSLRDLSRARLDNQMILQSWLIFHWENEEEKKTGLSNPHANPRNYWDEAEILFALHHSEQFSPGWSNKFMVPIFEQTNRW
jgi:hypothetical protein